MNSGMAMEDGVGPFFGLSTSPCLAVQPVRDAWFSVTHLQCKVDGATGRLVSLPREDAYFLMLYLKDTRHCDVAPNGVETAVRLYRQGSICLVDLAQGACIRLASDLESLAFYLPKALFAEVATFSHAPKTTRLRCRRGEDDETMHHLCEALLSLINGHLQDRPAIVPHIAIAICAHLLDVHADRSGDRRGPACLSIWQEKAAKDFMIDHFGEVISTAEVAAFVDLPVERFVSLFKRTTGQTPRRWLRHYRIRRARRFLADRTVTIDDVARRCGFTTRRQFETAFIEVTGIGPGEWRARWR